MTLSLRAQMVSVLAMTNVICLFTFSSHMTVFPNFIHRLVFKFRSSQVHAQALFYIYTFYVYAYAFYTHTFIP